MLAGVERLIDLSGARTCAWTGPVEADLLETVRNGDVSALSRTDGHFSGAAREGQTVRLARTIGLPLRYFVGRSKRLEVRIHERIFP